VGHLFYISKGMEIYQQFVDLSEIQVRPLTLQQWDEQMIFNNKHIHDDDIRMKTGVCSKP
jgi:hypothetical protein